MIDIKKDTVFCEFCTKLRLKTKKYTIYNIGIDTNLGFYTVGTMTIEEELNDYLLKKGSHLSGTQVILYRPDILKEFLKQKYDTEKEQISEVFLYPANICEECFEGMKKVIPLK
jgi:hypothetical protein